VALGAQLGISCSQFAIILPGNALVRNARICAKANKVAAAANVALPLMASIETVPYKSGSLEKKADDRR
jgi:hypothetical protein